MARVLLIEDGVVFRDLLAEALRRSGFEVKTAGDGEAGWGMLDAVQPDLIVLDLAMPRLDGISFLRRLRAQDKWSAVQVLVVSAHSSKAEDALRYGAQGYLIKSRISLTEVTETARNLVSVAESKRQKSTAA